MSKWQWLGLVIIVAVAGGGYIWLEAFTDTTKAEIRWLFGTIAICLLVAVPVAIGFSLLTGEIP
jgi:hypothetical protein